MAVFVDKDAGQNDVLYFNAGTLPAIFNGASAISTYVMAYPIDFGAATGGSNHMHKMNVGGVFAGNSINFFETGGNYYLSMGGRSATTDSFQGTNGSTGTATTISTGQWYSFLVINDFANDKQIGYVDGVEEFNATVSFGNTSFTDGGSQTQDDMLGSSDEAAVEDRQFDGNLAEFAMWDAALTAAEAASLANGLSPMFVRPNALKFYSPLRNDSELNDKVAGLTWTKLNTVTAVAHPRVINKHRGSF